MIIAYLEKHDNEKNMHRYYRLSICLTLFGQYALVREWGRCSQGFPGSCKKIEVWHTNPQELIALATEIMLKKQRKGYVSLYFIKGNIEELCW